MIESTSQSGESSAPERIVAAIDIGANAIRLEIAQVGDEGQIEVLEQLHQAVRLGQDTFRRGRLGGQSMRAAIDILRAYRQRLDLYGIRHIRAVTTSAVREAVNADNFLERIFMATRLNVEVIATSEESRLTVSAVRQALAGAGGVGVTQGKTLIADVGGGSTLLTIIEEGEIVNALGLRLGSIRLQELLATSEETPEAAVALLRHHIRDEMTSAERTLPLEAMDSFVAVGGDARFAAREIGKATDSADLFSVATDKYTRLVGRCVRMTPEELSKRFGLPFAEAETLNPALLVYQELLERTGVTRMIVSDVSMRDGLLRELTGDVTGAENTVLLEGVIHSAEALAEKFRVDLEHARETSELAVRLFDEVVSDHGLDSRHRLLLRVAGLLHEVGGYINSQAHHKHSLYIIRNSEIFGLTRREMELVALIARYHRRAAPKQSHIEYVSMPREDRIVINKLAAILRVVDALCRGNVRKLQNVVFERAGDDLIVHVPSQGDVTVQRRALSAKGDMFEDIFGMKARLETR